MSWIDTALSFMDQGRVGLLGGIVVAFVAYLLARKRTSLGYVYLGEHLLGSASDALPSGIVVQYNGISIPRLTKSILIFWNSGENTVNGEDIVAKDPLRFHVGDDGQILSAVILKSSRAVNDFSIFRSPELRVNELAFTFNFLDAKDGVVVEILHTSTDRKPSVTGTLKGLPHGFRNFGQFTRPKPQKKKRSGPLSVLTAVMFSPLAFACLGFLFAVYGPPPPGVSESAFSNGVMGGLGGFSAMWAINSWTTRRRYPKNLHLEALE